MSKINFTWIKNLTSKEDKVNFEQQVLADKFVLERLKEILDEYEQELSIGETGLDQFKDPNWSYLQAFRNGDRHRIAELKKLLTHLHDKE